MYKQMELFDFIENTQVQEQLEQKTMFDRLFTKINDPVMLCVNCLCEKCANNVEGRNILPEEQREACFNCDRCSQYTGRKGHMLQRKDDCSGFEISEYAAKCSRKKIRIVN